VFASQGQGGFTDFVRIGMGQLPGRAIVGREAVDAADAESFPQVSNGAGGEAEGGGEAGGGLALLGALE